MPQGNLVEVLGREVRQGSPGELMVESTPSRQTRPPCKTNKEESDEAADAAALTYLLTYCVVMSCCVVFCCVVLCCVVLCCVMSRRGGLCCAVSCCVVLCCLVLFCVVL